MMHKVTYSAAALLASLVAMPSNGQIFTDAEGDSSKWISADSGDAGAVIDIRYGFDYGNYDIFGDGFLTGTIPEAPNSAGGTTSTTGIFVSVNNDSFQFPPNDGSATSGQAAAAAVYADGVNVGAGTANPNFKMTVDVFHSTALGFDYNDGQGIRQRGSTNYVLAGALFEDTTTVEAERTNAGNDVGGIALATTGEGGSGGDWLTLIDGPAYSFDPSVDGLPDATGSLYENVDSGLASTRIVKAFEDAGFDIDTGGGDSMRENTDNATTYSYIPGDEASFDFEDDTTFRRYFVENFPTHSDPLHFTVDPVLQPGTAVENIDNTPGQAYNQWATHEIAVVDNTYYYSINGIPVMELDINDDPNDPDRTIYDDIAEAGTVMLGFWDRFNSISKDPEGANFAVFDNIVIESLNSGDAPFDLDAYLVANGWIPGDGGFIDGDYDGNGFVSQADLDLVLLNWGSGTIPPEWVAAGQFDGDQVSQNELDGVLLNWGNGTPPANAVPEPASLALLGLGGLALATRRRRA